MSNQPTIDITGVASQKMNEILEQEQMVGKGVRIYVEGGGCSGFQYGFAFDDKRDGDQTFTVDGLEVVVDPMSLQYLAGSTVDLAPWTPVISTRMADASGGMSMSQSSFRTGFFRSTVMPSTRVGWRSSATCDSPLQLKLSAQLLRYADNVCVFASGIH